MDIEMQKAISRQVGEDYMAKHNVIVPESERPLPEFVKRSIMFMGKELLLTDVVKTYHGNYFYHYELHDPFSESYISIRAYEIGATAAKSNIKDYFTGFACAIVFPRYSEVFYSSQSALIYIENDFRRKQKHLQNLANFYGNFLGED